MSLVTPHQLDLWSSNMSHLYNALEGEILKKMMDTLNTAGIENIETWQMNKLQQLRLFNGDVARLLSAVTPYAEAEIKKMFEETVSGTIDEVDSHLKDHLQAPPPTPLDNVMRGYHNQVWSEIDNYVNQTLISSNYGYGTAAQSYTEVLNRTTALFTTGIYTFDEALEKSVQELAQKGIKSSFVDKGGGRWSLERYTGTVLKSTLNNTYNAVKTERMAEFGNHTVVVTSHMGARLACSQIQGEVVDLRPTSELPENWPYRSIYDDSWFAYYGEPGGHRGVNCGHQHIPFIPGVNKNNQPKFDEKQNRAVAENQARQRQIERNIVKYKKNAMVSEHLKTDKADHWNQMVSKWEKEMENHLENNGAYLSRNHGREQVYTPLKTLLGE